MTVVTQFATSGAISRYYVQNGVTFQQPSATVGTYTGNSITTDYCAAEEAEFGGTSFSDKGGLAQINKAFQGGMVLVMSLWDDYAVNMLWLDSTYPANATGTPGAARGSCSTSSGVPAQVESQDASAKVIYSNIKFGPIGSTGGTGGSPPPPPPPPGTTTTRQSATSTGSSSTATQTHYGQCGGTGWTGPTKCASGTTCTVLNPFYSQCL